MVAWPYEYPGALSPPVNGIGTQLNERKRRGGAGKRFARTQFRVGAGAGEWIDQANKIGIGGRAEAARHAAARALKRRREILI
jgi:hypothetical protein